MPEEKKDPAMAPKGTHCLVAHDLVMEIASLLVSMPYGQVATIAPRLGVCEWVNLPEGPPQSATVPRAMKKKVKKKKGKR